MRTYALTIRRRRKTNFTSCLMMRRLGRIRADSESAEVSQRRVLEPLGASRSNSSSWASATAGSPSACRVAAFVPGVPLGVG